MKKTLSIIAGTIFLFLLSSCEYAVWEGFYRKHSVSERASSLYELPFAGDRTDTQNPGGAPDPSETTGTYYVAVFSDIHLYKSGEVRFEENFKNQLTSLKALNDEDSSRNVYPKFVLCLGDIADHGYESEYRDYVKFTDSIRTDFGLVTYNVLGNHDLYNTGWEPYEKLIYPFKSFYHFTTSSFSWYVLDSASGSLGPEQLRMFEEACKNDSRPKIILMHCPMYGDPYLNAGYFTMQNSYESDRLITDAEKDNVKLIMEGHTHRFYEQQIGSYTEHTVSSILVKHEWTLLKVDETNAKPQCYRVTEDVTTKEDFKRILGIN